MQRLFLTILGLFLICSSLSPILAEEKIINFGVAPKQASPEITYYLPYPGILPDHFLYPVKMIRDRVWLVLTSGSLQKAEVMLLFADKRLGAARVLIEGGKTDLGITTLTKAEKYLEQGAGKLTEAKKAGRELGPTKGKFSQAVLKHEEVILTLQEKAGADEQKVFSEILAKIEQLKKDLDNL